jgi:hypothetical protein
MSSSDIQAEIDGAQSDAWAKLARDVDERYRMGLERKDVQGELRYVAVARSLNLRPYAVVTTTSTNCAGR